jgi:hypothetical protein
MERLTIDIDTKPAHASMDKLRERVEENKRMVDDFNKSMAELNKSTRWYKQIPPVQWVILALLVCDIVVHIVRH